MTDRAALVEKVARAACEVQGRNPDEEVINRYTGNYVKQWTLIGSSIAAAIDIALEEAARVAKGDEASATPYYRGRVHAAAAIRALKGKPND